MSLDNWGVAFDHSLLSVGYGVISFLPYFIFALAIFAIGWLLAVLCEKLIEALFRSLKIDAALKSAGLEEIVKRSGYNLNSGLFVGALVKWFVIVVSLMTSFEILGLNDVNDFLREIAGYLPEVIIAVLILMIAVVIANALQKIVVASARAGKVKSAELLGRIAKWAIWIFAIVIALDKLVILPGLVQGIIAPLFYGLALAFGLAFGLGGKEAAQRIIDKTTQHVLEKE